MKTTNVQAKSFKKNQKVVALTTGRAGLILKAIPAFKDPYLYPNLMKRVPKRTFRDAAFKREQSYVIKYNARSFGWLTAKNLQEA